MKKANIDSPVLKNNLKELMSAMGIEEGEDSPILIMNASFANLNNFPNLGVYNESFTNLVNDFSIPKEIHEKYKIHLEEVASLYLKFYPIHLKPLAYRGHMARLKRIAKYSRLLKTEIANADQTFVEFLELVNHFEEKDEGEPPAYEFLNLVGQNLKFLEHLEQGVKGSFFGKNIGIGSPSKKQNSALYGWVSLHYNTWTKTLCRTMKRDKTGLGGRKKFLKYLDQLMAPLHPEMCSHNIDLSEVRENPVTNDAIATALRAVQKEIKVR